MATELALGEALAETIIPDRDQEPLLILQDFYLKHWRNFEAEIKRVDHQRAIIKEGLLKQLEALHYFHGEAFQRAIDEDLAKQGGKKKSVEHLEGTAGYRTMPERIDFIDQSVAMVWCEKHLPAAIKVTKTLSKTTIKKHVQDTGEVPHGIAAVSKRDKFFPGPDVPALSTEASGQVDII